MFSHGSRIPKALTIAGSDSGGGAGIEADLKTFSALGVHGLVALTAVTAQNTMGVSATHPIPPEIVSSQIEAVVSDIGVDVAKTGMLYSSRIIEEVAKSAEKNKLRLVVDPVMVSKAGSPLLQPDAVETFKSLIMPLAEVLTPNLDEAFAITGIKVNDLESSIAAGNRMLEMGAQNVVVKGGHLEGDPIDVLFQKGKPPKKYGGKRLPCKATHGTGCTFSAAIAAHLAKGYSIEQSVSLSKAFVEAAILYGYNIGKGVGPVNPLGTLQIDAARYSVIERMNDAIYLLERTDSLHSMSPECQINLGMALPAYFIRDIDDVCAIPGRIFNVAGKLKAAACPAFGASKHVAKVILSAMAFDESVRSCMNIKFSNEILEACREAGLTTSSYDRQLEPPNVKLKEGESIPWGVREAILSFGKVPDIIYHEGDVGKEPMINILGKDAVEVVAKAIRIGRVLDSKANKPAQ
ncbi:MAG: bifunctional hydroxymethylpyrimidine kinase/phosphomethylpyrimidine kinase [Candidatus Methanomethylicia archaeon]|nr:bifunctional hydroxymethylpyrimidine kinase/phosphomethylpyrimidine kinase [Candidatus Methanomethylicia archaeon]